MSIEAAAHATTVEATEQNFEEAVIQRSMQVPVLVDFWAPWCAPCRTLGPALEKLAGEYGGRFQLVKVNLDENPNIAYALQIQSIPAVKLIVDGAIRDEFMGAYPEPALREFLDRNLPSEDDRAARSGLDMLHAGNAEEAEQAFRRTLEHEPDNARALVGLGHILAERGEWQEAGALAERATEEEDLRRDLAQLRAKVLLHEHAADDAGAARRRLEDDPGDLQARLELACRNALDGGVEAALEHLLQIVRTDRRFDEDIGRRAMLAVFELLPPEEPLVTTYRNKLSSLLFS